MEELAQAIAELDEQRALDLARQQMEGRIDPFHMLEASRAGLEAVGQRFESGEYFLADLMMAGAIFTQIVELAGPIRSTGRSGPATKVVFGTVKGDVHDIGKNVVVTMLRADGFEVQDIGVDVPPERFVSALTETGATILGMSALLTISFQPMKETILALDRAGLRERVKVMVGGGPVNERACEHVGADGFGKNAIEAVYLCRKCSGRA